MHRQVDSCFKVNGTGQRIRCPALGASRIMQIRAWVRAESWHQQGKHNLSRVVTSICLVFDQLLSGWTIVGSV